MATGAEVTNFTAVAKHSCTHIAINKVQAKS